MRVRIMYDEDGRWNFTDQDGQFAYFVPGWLTRENAVSHCEALGDVVVNKIMHSIFEYPSNMGLNASEQAALRDLYQELLDRAVSMTSHDSGWVSSTMYASPADANQARIISRQYFMTGGYKLESLPPLNELPPLDYIP